MQRNTWTVRYWIGGTENRESRQTVAFQTHKEAHDAAAEIKRGGRDAEVWRSDLLAQEIKFESGIASASQIAQAEDAFDEDLRES